MKNVQVPIRYSADLLRFPVLLQNRDEIYAKFQSEHLYLGKWYSEIIDPKGTMLETFSYQNGMCPKTEVISKTILNLPTYPTMRLEDARKIANLLKKYVANS